MNSPLPFHGQANCWKLDTDKYEADRVSKTLRKIEHILAWQPSSTYNTGAETRRCYQTKAEQAACVGTPVDKCWKTTIDDRSSVAPRLGTIHRNDSVTSCDVIGRLSKGEVYDQAKKKHFDEQKYSALATNANKYDCVESQNTRRFRKDARHACGTAPIPAGQLEMTSRQKTPRYVDYCFEIARINCGGNSHDRGYTGTNILEEVCSSDSESDVRSRKYGFTRRRSQVECCDKHRGGTNVFSADINRASSRDVGPRNHSGREPLHCQPRRTLTTTSSMPGRRSSAGGAVSTALPDFRRFSGVTEETTTMEDFGRRDIAPKELRRSSASSPRRVTSPPKVTDPIVPIEDSRAESTVPPESKRRPIIRDSESKRRGSWRTIPVDPDSFPGPANTAALVKVRPTRVEISESESNRRRASDSKRPTTALGYDTSLEVANTTTATTKETQLENPAQPEGTRGSIMWNSGSRGSGTQGFGGRTTLPENRRVTLATEEKRKSSQPPAEAESDGQEEIPAAIAPESSLSEVDPGGQSKSSTDSHGAYGERLSLTQPTSRRPTTREPSEDKSFQDCSRSSPPNRPFRRHRASGPAPYDNPTIASSEKSPSAAAAAEASAEYERRGPDSEEFVTMLQNQATIVCMVEAENKFLKSELISVRRTLGSLVAENSFLHERLKHRMVDELLRSSEEDERTQDIHRQGSAFVLSLACSPQTTENNAALCRLLTKYDFQKVKKEFETIIRLHRIKSDSMEAQLKFSRSEVNRLGAEVTDLQRKLGPDESFLMVDAPTRNFCFGLCVRCSRQASAVLSSAEGNDSRNIGQLVRERDELVDRVLATKAVCSLAMDREAELHRQLCSFIINFETAQLEVLEALRQRQEMQDELNRVVESTRGERHQDLSCWKRQLEMEQAESEQRNLELARKVEELLGELEIQNRKLCKTEREKELLQERCEATSCRIRRIEDDFTKEIEELKKSLCRLTRDGDDARQLVRTLEHQLIIAKTANDQEGSKPEPEAAVNGVFDRFSSFEAHINSKVDQLQEYYGQALRDRDDVIRQQTTVIKKLKKKYCKMKHRIRQSRKRNQIIAVKPESKNHLKKSKTDEQDKPSNSVPSAP